MRNDVHVEAVWFTRTRVLCVHNSLHTNQTEICYAQFLLYNVAKDYNNYL